jgi:hypothetical protein
MNRAMSIGPDIITWKLQQVSLLLVQHETSVMSSLTSLFQLLVRLVPKLGVQTDFRDASSEDDPVDARREPEAAFRFRDFRDSFRPRYERRRIIRSSWVRRTLTNWSPVIWVAMSVLWLANFAAAL